MKTSNIAIAGLCMLLAVGCATTTKDRQGTQSSSTAAADQPIVQEHPRTEHPRVELATEVRTDVERLAWEEAQQIHTIEADQSFIARYPQGQFVYAARNARRVLTEQMAGLEALLDYGPEYKGYRLGIVSEPITAPDISLRIVCRVDRFVGTAPVGSGGVRINSTTEIGALSLDAQQQEQAAQVFDQAVTAALSRRMRLNDDSRYRFFVVSGVGGGMIVGSGGYLDAEVFLLDTEARALLAYSDDPMGKGNSADPALRNLAEDVAKSFSRLVMQD